MVPRSLHSIKRDETVSENVDAGNAVKKIVEVVQRRPANLNIPVDPRLWNSLGKPAVLVAPFPEIDQRCLIGVREQNTAGFDLLADRSQCLHRVGRMLQHAMAKNEVE
jgi:hypothetical protein